MQIRVLSLRKMRHAVVKQGSEELPAPSIIRTNGSLKLLMIRSWNRRGRATRNQSGRGIPFFLFYFT